MIILLASLHFPQLGIEARFVDPENLDDMPSKIDGKTRAVFCEAIGNPGENVVELETISDIAHAHGIPVIIDN